MDFPIIMKKYLSIMLLLSLLIPVSGWDDGANYYMMPVDHPPTVDGILGINEWETEEDPFESSVTPVYLQGITRVNLDVTLVRDGFNLYGLIGIQHANLKRNSISVGMAFSEDIPTQMTDVSDLKVAYHNGNETDTYDLHSCLAVKEALDCTEIELQPGIVDNDNEFDAEFVIGVEKVYFEFIIPLEVEDNIQDLSISHGVYLSILVNIYANIIEEGHGGSATSALRIRFNKSLFSNPWITTITILVLIPVLYLVYKKFLAAPSK